MTPTDSIARSGRRSLVRVLAGAAVACSCLPAAASASPAVRRSAAGDALASGVLLQRVDLGRGWSAVGGQQVGTLTCPGLHVSLRGVTETGAAVSRRFSHGASGPFVSQTAFVYASPAEQGEVWDRVMTPGYSRCAAASLLSGATGRVRFQVSRRQRLSLPRVAARQAGYRVVGDAIAGSVTIPVYLDVVALGAGPVLTEISVSSFDQPVSRRLELSLARAVARRLHAPLPRLRVGG